MVVVPLIEITEFCSDPKSVVDELGRVPVPPALFAIHWWFVVSSHPIVTQDVPSYLCTIGGDEDVFSQHWPCTGNPLWSFVGAAAPELHDWIAVKALL
jgi:hypothetical protein